MNYDDLGGLISTHKSGLFEYWWCFLLSGCFLVLALLIWSARNGPSDNGTLVYIFLIFFVLTLIPLFIAWYYSINEARLYEKGFVYITRRSKKTVLWSEVKYVYEFAVRVNVNGISTAPQYRFGVRTEDDMIVRFSPRLWKIQELGAVLMNVAEQLNLPIVKGVPYRFGSPEPERTKTLDI